MSAGKENAALLGVGVAACAACCAGPILGVLAAIGLGTAAGIAVFGTIAIVLGVAAVAFVVFRRRRAAARCAAVPVEPVAVEVSSTRSR